MLKRMKIKDTENCDYCDVKEYIEHMFIHCKKLWGFWDHVFRTIFHYTNKKFTANEADILLGFSPKYQGYKNTDINIANHILLIAKMSVGKVRYGKCVSIIFTFDNEIAARKRYLKPP